MFRIRPSTMNWIMALAIYMVNPTPVTTSATVKSRPLSLMAWTSLYPTVERVMMVM